MLSKGERRRFTEIPTNVEVIEIDDESENHEASNNPVIQAQCEQRIETAILTKSLDDMKKAIFICLEIKRLNSRSHQAQAIVRENYIKYFKEKLNISIANQCFNPRHQVPDQMTEINPQHIIVHGVDFLTNTQIQNKFKGLHPVKIQRIDSSNASVQFSNGQNVQNVLSIMQKHAKVYIEGIEEIQPQGKYQWKMLRKYNVLGFDRILKYRYASVDEQIFAPAQTSIKKYENAKSSIQLSELFIQHNEDKTYFDEQWSKFSQSLTPRHRRSYKSRSEFSQSCYRERSREGRNQRLQGRDLDIDGFRDRFNNRRQNRRKYDNQNERNGQGYRTQRYNNRDDKNQSFTDRRRYDRKEENFRRGNRFFDMQNKQDGFKQVERQKSNSKSSKSMSIQKLQKSISRSSSNSNKSYGLNNKNIILENNQQSVNQSMSFAYGRKNDSILKQKIHFSVDQNKSFSMNLNNMNNFSLFQNDDQDPTVSMIVLNKGDLEQKVEEDNESVGDLLKKIEKDENQGKSSRSKSAQSKKKSSVKNSSIMSNSRKNSSFDMTENKKSRRNSRSNSSRKNQNRRQNSQSHHSSRANRQYNNNNNKSSVYNNNNNTYNSYNNRRDFNSYNNSNNFRNRNNSGYKGGYDNTRMTDQNSCGRSYNRRGPREGQQEDDHYNGNRNRNNQDETQRNSSNYNYSKNDNYSSRNYNKTYHTSNNNTNRNHTSKAQQQQEEIDY